MAGQYVAPALVWPEEQVGGVQLRSHRAVEHDDAVAEKQRVAAYVLGLTAEWRTEWGGLLMFHDSRGDVERALIPRFNTLTMFRVPKVHSVSAVAAAAARPRCSITGWLRKSQ